MNLDDVASFAEIDTQKMLAQIDELPDQLSRAWEIGQDGKLPDVSGVRQVVIAGMGGSAIGADLLSAYSDRRSQLPIIVHRDYELPNWAKGPETFVIACSHSGNTEETLSAFQTALAHNCKTMVITTGGELAQLANKAGVTCWIFEHHGQPRAAVGYSFGQLLALVARLGIIPDPESELHNAVDSMRAQFEDLKASTPVSQNPAKRYAGQLIGRWVTVFGSGLLAPVARRWKGQVSEVAKAWSQFEFLPEADHNTLAGIMNPADLFSRHFAIFLRAPSEHPRNRLRSDLTRQAFMLEGIATDFVDGRGETPLAQMWTCLHFGDYVSYYLAMAYEVDPTPIPAIEYFKGEMAASG